MTNTDPRLAEIKDKIGLDFRAEHGGAHNGKFVADLTDEQLKKLEPLIRQGLLGKVSVEFADGKQRIVIGNENIDTMMHNINRLEAVLGIDVKLEKIKNRTGLDFHSVEDDHNRDHYKGKVVVDLTNEQWKKLRALLKQNPELLGKYVTTEQGGGITDFDHTRIVIQQDELGTVMQNLDKIESAMKGSPQAKLDNKMLQALAQYEESRNIPTGGSHISLPFNLDVVNKGTRGIVG